jgi:YbgC/YbaW family acyl-CoA thioester hydrolase
MHRFNQRRRVAFAETDLAGIVHFSNFFRYMEDCEHAFYRVLGYSAHAMDDGEGGTVGWPRVHAEADYRQPFRFEEEFEIELLVEAMAGKTISYRLRFWKDPDGARVLAAEGKVVVVCVRFAEEGMRSTEIPASIRAKIEVAPAKLLENAAR